MPAKLRIPRSPVRLNRYLVDANFLVNRFIPLKRITKPREQQRVQRSLDWWAEIDQQLEAGKAVVYTPDVCIAEAFKVLAKKRYEDRYFANAVEYKRARDSLSDLIRVPTKTLKASRRRIPFHDVSTSRDVVIAVDRFFEGFHKWGLNVSVVDLIILATAKYLVDFFHVPEEELFIVTLDNALWKGAKKMADVPAAFNPAQDADVAIKAFA